MKKNYNIFKKISQKIKNELKFLAVITHKKVAEALFSFQILRFYSEGKIEKIKVKHIDS